MADLLRALRRNAVVDLVLTLAVVLGLVYGVQRWIVKPYRIPSISMERTLHVGDHVLVARFWYRFTSPSRGDIIVFHPNGSGQDAFNTTHVASVTYVKRLIGLPGDWVWGTDGHVRICKQRESGCTTLAEKYVSSAITSFGPTHVPKGHYFMMGDNRDESDDSRDWGMIRYSQIIGRAFAIYWPPDRLSAF